MKIFLPSQLLLIAQKDPSTPLYQQLWPQIGLLVAVAFILILIYLMKNRLVRKKVKKLKIEKQNLLEKLARFEKINQDLEVVIQQKNLEVEKVVQELDKMVSIDSVTGIANFKRFAEFFKQEWARAARYSRTISLIIIEMDFMKEYQETYGIETFNKSLRKIAQMLVEIIRRPGDIAARYENGDFVLVLSETEAENVADLAEMIRVGTEYLDIETSVSTISKHATISLGCATIRPKPDSDPSTLVKAAKIALAQAKENGGNRIHTINPL